jgi:Ca2+-binding RTX toxin-like protein
MTRIVGTERDERLTGTVAADTIDGYGGDDTLIGAGGNDALWGGDGWDLLDGGDGDDELLGGPGGDVIRGGSGNDLLFGFGYRFDIDLSFEDAPNLLIGGAGDDFLISELAGDTLVGGLGDDTLSVRFSPADDETSMFGGSGSDLFVIDGSRSGGILIADMTDLDAIVFQGVNTATADFEVEVLNGRTAVTVFARFGSVRVELLGEHPEIEGSLDTYVEGISSHEVVFLRLAEGETVASSNEFLDGTAGADSLDGGTGNDVIYGWEGNDTLVGGAGIDFVDGGAGDDVIYL